MNTILLLLVSVCGTIRTARCAEQLLAIKAGIEDFNDSIAIGAKTYLDLVKNSKVFVDNSLIIKELFFYPGGLGGAVLLLGPSKWGSSMNLDMYRMFFDPTTEEKENRRRLFESGEIVLDDGRIEKLITPLRITTEDDFFKSYYKENYRRVIHLSFKDVIGNNATVVKEKMYEAFEKTFKKYGKSPPPWKDLKKSMSSLLHFVTKEYGFETYGIVIIEDYDKPILNFLQNEHPPTEDTNEIYRLLKDLIPYTFWDVYKPNRKNEFLLDGGFVSARFNLESHDGFRAVYHIAKKISSIDQYFGFNEENVRKLFELHKMDEKLAQQALEWYGYRPRDKRFYNPLSIARFLKEKKITGYCKTDENQESILKALKTNPKIIKHLLSLISKRSVSIPCSQQLEFEYKPVFSRMFCKDKKMESEEKCTDETMFLSYLLNNGYLVRDDNSDQAKLPNHEMTFVIANHLISFYKSKYKISDERLEIPARALYHLADGIANKTKQFEKSLANFFHQISPSVSNINGFRSILTCVTLRMQCKSKFKIDIYYEMNINADYVIINEEKGYAIFLKLFSNLEPKDGIKFTEEYKKIWRLYDQKKQIEKITIIAIQAATNNTVNILAKTFNREWQKK